MTAHYCCHCGKRADDDAVYCAQCGAPLSGHDDLVLPDRADQLLAAARLHQEAGDLEAARRCAHEALSLRPDCAAIHSMLGCLHQQMGHESSARLHFQAALAITPPAAPATEMPEPAAARPHGTLWVTLVLAGCIIFSALAMLFVFRDSTHATEQAALLHTLQRPPLPVTPQWTWHPPAPAQVVMPAPAPVTHSDTALVSSTTTVRPQPPAIDVPPPPPDQTLGAASGPRTVVLVGAPTIEKAEQAYFRGDYERAATIYEALIRDSSASDPRLHQDLAWCYQQLGSSGKATQHLNEAIRGFEGVLASDPRNTAAQQGLSTCQTALSELLTTRTRP
jgi:hypothetical protein